VVCVVCVVCVGVWGCGGGGGFPLRSNIPRSALCATLDTYNFILNENVFQNPVIISDARSFSPEQSTLVGTTALAH
jgi:hypothetical protein